MPAVPLSDARRRANEKYNAKAYDEIKIRVPKGKKAFLMAKAERENSSLNSLITAALLDKLGLAEWPQNDE